MTRIHMDTEVVRETARLLGWTSGELNSLPTKIRNLAGSLSSVWQGGRSGHYASELRNVGEILQREVINLQRLAESVGDEVNEWENADAAFGKVVSSIAVSSEVGQPWWETSKKIREYLSGLGTIGKGLATLGIISGLASGASYAGQVIFHGGQGLKSAAGLSSHLTHIKAANLPRHLLNQSKKIKGLEIIMGVWEFAEKGAKDWAKYEKGSEKATALGIDALFVVGKTVATHYAAYAITHVVTTVAIGLLATAGAPVVGVAAVGVAAVGLVTWWGASYAAGNIIDKGYGLAETSEAKDAIVKSGGSMIESIGNGIQETARAVDRVFDPTIQRTVSM